MKKTENLRDSSKLDPLIFSVLFRFAAQTRTALPSGLPLGWLVRCFRRFAAAKRAGRRAATRVICVLLPRRSATSRSFFPKEKRRIPAGTTIQQEGQADHAKRDRARETRRKRVGTMMCKLACNISVSDSFSYSLPKQANLRLPFGVSSRGGFGLQSRPLERSPHP